VAAWGRRAGDASAREGALREDAQAVGTNLISLTRLLGPQGRCAAVNSRILTNTGSRTSLLSIWSSDVFGTYLPDGKAGTASNAPEPRRATSFRVRTGDKDYSVGPVDSAGIDVNCLRQDVWTRRRQTFYSCRKVVSSLQALAHV
jgi:hypothetical protein